MRPRVLTITALLALAAAGCTAEPATTGHWVAPSPSSALSPSVATVAPPAGNAPARTFPVTSREVVYEREGRRLRTVIWTPDGVAKAPAVLFSHGLNGAPEHFAPLLTRWAAAGFVIVAPAYPNTTHGVAKLDIADVLNQPADASHVLSQVLTGPLGTRIDAQRLGAAGHSAGGITTVGLFSVGRDERLRAGIVMAGNALGVGAAFAGPPAALLFVHGDADPLVSYASGKAAYDLVPWSKALFTLKGQNHGDPYLRPTSTAFPSVATTTLDFLRFTLYGDPTAKGRLPKDPALFDNHL